MQRCLDIAKSGEGHVAPNPMVGAVLVHDENIIGEGYHTQWGGPHAEVNCIQSVPDGMKYLIPESVMYVSLEPCSHFGKTPPCANLIIENKIPEVVIGCMDINEKVSGKGIATLRNAGVKVRMSAMEKECIHLNRRFFTFHNQKRPYIILKWAQTMNGIMGKHSGRLYISNEYTNILVQKWRGEEAAILVGNHTALNDDPRLTNRSGTGTHPLRIILSNDHLPVNRRMFGEPGSTLVFNTVKSESKEEVTFRKVSKENYLEDVLTFLHSKGIQSILVEGGAYTLQQFLDKGLWDECRIITNTEMVVAEGVKSPALPDMECNSTLKIQGDLIQSYTNRRNPFVACDKLYY